MKQQVGSRRSAKQQANDKPKKLLGTRHHYESKDAVPNLGQSAKSIGFSPSEVFELERLYVSKLKGGVE